jgi:hypothetical protein
VVQHGIRAKGPKFEPYLSHLPFHFQLNIQCVGPHLLKGNLSPHVRGSVKVLIK